MTPISDYEFELGDYFGRDGLRVRIEEFTPEKVRAEAVSIVYYFFAYAHGERLVQSVC